MLSSDKDRAIAWPVKSILLHLHYVKHDNIQQTTLSMTSHYSVLLTNAKNISSCALLCDLEVKCRITYVYLCQNTKQLI